MKINSSSRFSHLYFSVVLFFSLIMSTATYGNNFLSFTFDSFSEIKSKFKDQEFLLGLWSVDCPPCLVELNMMGELLELNPDLPFVLISTDSIDTKEDAIDPGCSRITLLKGCVIPSTQTGMESYHVAISLIEITICNPIAGL